MDNTEQQQQRGIDQMDMQENNDPLPLSEAGKQLAEEARKYFASLYLCMVASGDSAEAAIVNEWNNALNESRWSNTIELVRSDYRALLVRCKERSQSTNGTNRPPHQLRVIEEKAALDEKLASLDAFCKTDTCMDLPIDERSRLMRQSSLMRAYSKVLGERIASF